MKDCKTIKIETLLQEFDENTRKEIVDTYNSCLESICCVDVKWQEFEIFLPSREIAKVILEQLAPEYIMIICDELSKEERKENIVKITFQQSKYDKGVYTVNCNNNTTLAVIYYQS